MAAPLTPPLFDRIGGRPRLVYLLQHFYADVRQNQEIAPIFIAHIENWPQHLEKIADFWSGVTGGPRLYSGPMPFKHLSLGLAERHFEAWLDLWRRHCRIHLPTTEAEELIALAEIIGQRLGEIVNPPRKDPLHGILFRQDP